MPFYHNQKKYPIINLYKTSGAFGGSDTIISDASPVAEGNGFTRTFNLIDFKGSGIWIKCFPVTPLIANDNIQLKLYTHWNNLWLENNIEIDTIDITNNGVETTKAYQMHALTHGVGFFKLSVNSTGGSDTFNCQIDQLPWVNQTIGS